MNLTKPFKIGFFAGVIFIVLMNVLSGSNFSRFTDRSVVCFDCYESYGFPFTIYESGTILHFERFNWFGIIGDSLIAVFAGAVIGIMFQLCWNRISSRRNRLTQ